jgi:hypothetical protein
LLALFEKGLRNFEVLCQKSIDMTYIRSR